MNDLKEMAAMVGGEVEWKFSDGFVMKLVPLKGNYLPKIIEIFKLYEGALESSQKPDGSIDEQKAIMNLNPLAVEKLFDMIYEWVDLNIDSPPDFTGDREMVVNCFVNDRLAELVEAFREIHGFDKKTLKEETAKEVGEIRERIKSERKPRRDRNKPSGIVE